MRFFDRFRNRPLQPATIQPHDILSEAAIPWIDTFDLCFKMAVSPN
jgi:hypothetical protein